MLLRFSSRCLLAETFLAPPVITDRCVTVILRVQLRIISLSAIFTA
jgi:hypothetical protein